MPCASTPFQMKVLTFNICHSAALALPRDGLTEVARVIMETGCDVCAIQEADGSQCSTCCLHGVVHENPAEIMVELLRLLGGGMGWHHGSVSTATCILSKFRIVAEYPAEHHGRSAGAVAVELPAGDTVLIYNVHLTWESQPQLVLQRNNHIVTPGMLQEEWVTRGREITCIIEEVEKHSRCHNTSIILGDFNTQSHLDDSKIPWPITRTLEKHGFTDAYREVHSVHHKGHTWYVPLTNYNMSKEVHGRLDYVFIKANDKHNSSNRSVLKHAGVVNRPPWPSDHKALCVELEILIEKS